MSYDPRLLSFDRWVALVGASLISFGYAPIKPSEEHWRDWANAVRNIPKVSALHVPRPDGFATWRDWGFRLSEALISVGL